MKEGLFPGSLKPLQVEVAGEQMRGDGAACAVVQFSQALGLPYMLVCHNLGKQDWQ